MPRTLHFSTDYGALRQWPKAVGAKLLEGIELTGGLCQDNDLAFHLNTKRLAILQILSTRNHYKLGLGRIRLLFHHQTNRLLRRSRAASMSADTNAVIVDERSAEVTRYA